MTEQISFLNNFDQKNEVTIKWYWEPFHKNGILVHQWINKNLINDSHEQKMKMVDQYLENISVIAAPAKFKVKNPQWVNESGGILALDPTVRILQTLKESNNSDFFISKISVIRKELKNWIPDIDLNPENMEICGLWASQASILAKYHQLATWDKLEIHEAIFGLTKSHTTLKFQRIDAKDKLP